jgi:hypothetical protein
MNQWRFFAVSIHPKDVDPGNAGVAGIVIEQIQKRALACHQDTSCQYM